MTDLRRALIIVPTYNEGENIQPLLDAVLALPSGFDILVVDDASPDGTADLVRRHAQFGRRAFLLPRAEKLGLGTAYRAGFAWALERPYAAVCQLDGDFSHSPADLERLLEASSRADIALGSRYIPGGGVHGWARHRELLSRSANVYARCATGVPVRDLTGGFKCFNRRALEAIPLDRINSEGYAFQIETTVHLARAGFSVAEVPICFRERRLGVSKISRHVIWEALWVVARLALRR